LTLSISLWYTYKVFNRKRKESNMSQFTIMENLITDIRRDHEDKPIAHARAKNLLKMVQKLVRDTQPGTGEFKWTQAARKALMKSPNYKGANPALMVAREGDEVWHTNGYYLVKGEPSKWFEPCEYQDLPMQSVKQIITDNKYLPEINIVGGEEVDGPDCVKFDNDVYVQRVFISYVTSMIGGPVIYKCAGKLYPVHVIKDGVTLGLIMPYNGK